MSSEVKLICVRVSPKWIFVVMGFIAVFCAFAMRLCLPSMLPILTRMPKIHSEVISSDRCPIETSTTLFGALDILTSNHIGNETQQFGTRNETAIEDETYEWSEHTQGIILSSFYVGYVPSHLPGGILAERFGGKHVVGLGMLGAGLITLMTAPVIRLTGWSGLAVLRALAGLCEGVVFPGLSTMLANWVPPSQRARLSSLVFNGASLGILLFSGLLGPIVRAWGWPGPFYTWGTVSCIWWVGWCALCHSSPQRHPCNDEAERRQLEIKMRECAVKERSPPVPWSRMLASGPFWALAVATAGRNWVVYTCISDLPKYEIGVLRFTVDEIGMLSVYLQILSLVASMTFSWFTDWSIERGMFSRTGARKLMTSIGLTGFGLGNLLSYLAGCDKTLYATFVLVAMIAGSAGFPGIKANALDLAPNYAGTIMATSHGIAGKLLLGVHLYHMRPFFLLVVEMLKFSQSCE
ncbi:hypothetical protein QAD02_019555 [Eretmocerus hayati]|uniref:Uncharacterized protein n=1 Tax=Eretmocerus hayati TaxID=131215 RepID=A0ACC2PL09_9HYME|nr:hypothetical protein QAD02_019555 [Eretmocerus hayati]